MDRMEMTKDIEMYERVVQEFVERTLDKNILSLSCDEEKEDLCKFNEIQIRNAMFACAFESRIHEDYHKVKEMVDQRVQWWFGRLLDKKLIDGVIVADLPMFASMVYATTLPEYLPSVTKFLVWTYIVDDLIDKPRYRGANLEATDALLAAITDTLIQHADLGMAESPTKLALLNAAGISSAAFISKENESTDDEMVDALVGMAREWWSEMVLLGMPPFQQIRFLRGTLDYFHVSRQQVAYRARLVLPGFDTFNHFRLFDASDFGAICVLLEYALGIELDEQTRCHPLFRQLLSNAGSHICAVNDVLGFSRENREGDFINLVPLLYFHKLNVARHTAKLARVGANSAGGSEFAGVNSTGDGEYADFIAGGGEVQLLDSVLNEISSIIAEHEQECVRLLQLIKECPALMEKPGLPAYLQGVCDWISGSHKWHFLSPRFKDLRLRTTKYY